MGIGLLGHFLALLVTLVLARTLPVADFDIYVTASAAFLVMVKLAPGGVEKLALGVIPPLRQRGEWTELARYVRFARRRAFLGASVVGLGAATLAALSGFAADGRLHGERLAVAVAGLGLPLAVYAHLGVEAMSALDRPVLAATIFRLGVPVVTLAVVLSFHALGSGMTAVGAVLAWGAGWAFAAAVYAGLLARSTIGRLLPLTARDPRGEHRWTRAALPHWAYRIALALTSSAGIFALDWFERPSSEIGAFAAAAAIVAPLAAAVMATNRFYAGELALHIDAANIEASRRLRVRRLAAIIPLSAVVVTFVFVFPERLLALFGPTFAEDGVAALRLLTLAAAVSAMGALAPKALKFSGRPATTLKAAFAALVVQCALLVVLVPLHGATAAAVAFLAAMAVLHGLAGIAARR